MPTEKAIRINSSDFAEKYKREHIVHRQKGLF